MTVVPIPGGRLLLHRDTKVVARYEKCLNSGGEYVKNSSTLAVSVQINVSIKFSFVSVNGPRETYFVDALPFFLSLLFTLPNVGPTPPGFSTQMPVDQIRVWEATDCGPVHYTETHDGPPPSTCGQHNIRVTAIDKTGQNTKDTHPVQGWKLKFLAAPRIETGPPGCKAGTLPTK